jgi:hypothetical protein
VPTPSDDIFEAPLAAVAADHFQARWEGQSFVFMAARARPKLVAVAWGILFSASLVYLLLLTTLLTFLVVSAMFTGEGELLLVAGLSSLFPALGFIGLALGTRRVRDYVRPVMADEGGLTVHGHRVPWDDISDLIVGAGEERLIVRRKHAPAFHVSFYGTDAEEVILWLAKTLNSLRSEVPPREGEISDVPQEFMRHLSQRKNPSMPPHSRADRPASRFDLQASPQSLSFATTAGGARHHALTRGGSTLVVGLALVGANAALMVDGLGKLQQGDGSLFVLSLFTAASLVFVVATLLRMCSWVGLGLAAQRVEADSAGLRFTAVDKKWRDSPVDLSWDQVEEVFADTESRCLWVRPKAGPAVRVVFRGGTQPHELHWFQAELDAMRLRFQSSGRDAAIAEIGKGLELAAPVGDARSALLAVNIGGRDAEGLTR